MFWLDTSWVLDLTYIFKSHPSLFIVIFSTLTSSSSLSPTSHPHLLYSSFFFLLSLLTRHYPCFTLSGGFSRVTIWGIITLFPLIHPMGSGSEISVWEVVLLVRIHVASVCGECLIIWVYIFIGDHSLLIRVCSKKKKKDSAFFIVSFSIGHVYGRVSLLHWVCVRESLYESFFFRFHLGIYFGWGYESPVRFLWERRATFL